MKKDNAACKAAEEIEKNLLLAILEAKDHPNKNFTGSEHCTLTVEKQKYGKAVAELRNDYKKLKEENAAARIVYTRNELMPMSQTNQVDG